MSVVATEAPRTPSPSGARAASRLAPLDALRGIAIAWVAIYHFCSFWAPSGAGDAVLPYGDLLAWMPFSSVGYLGVTLFFMISGFVILMTLERTATIGNFAVRRIARIWPTLALCGCLTWMIAWAIGPDQFKANPIEFFLSILAFPPQYIGDQIGQPEWAWLDGAYWSLWVEIRFYAVIGVCFFVLRSRWMMAWFSFQAICALLMLAYWVTGNGAFEKLGSLLFFKDVVYFSIGVIAYKAYSEGAFSTSMKVALAFCAVHAVATVLILNSGALMGIEFFVAYAAIFVLFGAALWSDSFKKMLSWSPLVQIGRASYSFYLLHQVIGLSIMYWAGQFMPGWAVAAFVLPTTLAVLLVASRIIFTRYEQPLNRSIVRLQMQSAR
ncbi:acyltransferase [Henriciella sp. AS95]|uniref:acyltransferase family protein n=1 Tax=Henriciella sp. AS95 TaxID=3135782 RepID=UPI00316CAC38